MCLLRERERESFSLKKEKVFLKVISYAFIFPFNHCDPSNVQAHDRVLVLLIRILSLFDLGSCVGPHHNSVHPIVITLGSLSKQGGCPGLSHLSWLSWVLGWWVRAFMGLWHPDSLLFFYLSFIVLFFGLTHFFLQHYFTSCPLYFLL